MAESRGLWSSKNYEEWMVVKVAYLGPKGTYTHEAAVERFDASLASIQYIPCKTITETFETLLDVNSDISFACLPISNSSQGPVLETQAFLSTKQAEALEELSLVKRTIRHAIMRHPEATGEVKEVVSHPQAIGQCKSYIASHYPSALIKEADSTSAAAQYASEHLEAIAICSLLAGQEFGLVLVDDQNGVGVQDVGEGNVTTFGIYQKR